MIDYDSMNEPGIYPSVKGKMGNKLSNEDLRVIYDKENMSKCE